MANQKQKIIVAQMRGWLPCCCGTEAEVDAAKSGIFDCRLLPEHLAELHDNGVEATEFMLKSNEGIALHAAEMALRQNPDIIKAIETVRENHKLPIQRACRQRDYWRQVIAGSEEREQQMEDAKTALHKRVWKQYQLLSGIAAFNTTMKSHGGWLKFQQMLNLNPDDTETKCLFDELEALHQQETKILSQSRPLKETLDLFCEQHHLSYNVYTDEVRYDDGFDIVEYDPDVERAEIHLVKWAGILQERLCLFPK